MVSRESSPAVVRSKRLDTSLMGAQDDTGFTLDDGETVVVGTSRARGGTAIIALLTAVPRGVKK